MYQRTLQANEADLLLSMIEDPGSFAIVCVKTLKGYFLLNSGAEQEVLDTVALPVAKALEADPGVLHFPLCWNMCVGGKPFRTLFGAWLWVGFGSVRFGLVRVGWLGLVGWVGFGWVWFC